MRPIVLKLVAIAAALGLLVAGGTIAAGKSGDKRHGGATFRTTLTGYEEVPAVSSAASGSFKATLNRSQTKLTWKLTYRGLETPVQQAHVHFGQAGVNGGVSLFLCSNLSGAPAGTQACPSSPATISGVARAQNVVGPVDQGIAPGELDELVAAMRARLTYANVHTDAFPNGEMRGQLRSHR